MHAENAALAHPPPLKPERRIVFLFLPSFAETKDDAVRGLRVELLHCDEGRVSRDSERRMVAGAVECAGREIEQAKKKSWRNSSFLDGTAVDRDPHVRIRTARREMAAADHERRREPCEGVRQAEGAGSDRDASASPSRLNERVLKTESLERRHRHQLVGILGSRLVVVPADSSDPAPVVVHGK